MNNRGFALIFGFTIIAVLAILAGATLSRSISEVRLTQEYTESNQAFWLAEAGLAQVLATLRNDSSVTSISATPLGSGGYSAAISGSGTSRTVIGSGFLPYTSPRLTRSIQVTMVRHVPPDFYDNAIYSAENVDLKGTTYIVNGNVTYATNITNTGNINGTIEQDASISPLARLDFQQLRTISVAQGNLYVVSGSKLVNQATGLEGFPASFWYSAPTNSSDPTTGTPNIVYIEGDLTLNGNIGTIGGFFVVAGDVINTPDITQDATINGIGMVEGAIYTRGEFRINGGGGNLNVNGGVWSGDQARLNGNAQVDYNATIMGAIEGLGLSGTFQISNWHDLANN